MNESCHHPLSPPARAGPYTVLYKASAIPGVDSLRKHIDSAVAGGNKEGLPLATCTEVPVTYIIIIRVSLYISQTYI